jgi:predicted DCC family thiol-disulfide oxidoreductase YuxK
MLYDGLCGFCNWTVRWVLKRDRNDRFRFAAQQSAIAGEALSRHGIDQEAALAGNSVYLLLNYGTPHEALFSRSDVTVHILELLGGVWGIAGRLLRLVPRSLRDWAYGVVATNRYRIAKRYETCPIPSPGERAKFVA